MLTLQRVKNFFSSLILTLSLLPAKVFADFRNIEPAEKSLKFQTPGFSDILTFIIRAFFVVAGIFALIYLLLGAFSWITSGGDKEKVESARNKIQAALVGIILIIIVVALVATLEQIVFQQTLCFGLTCAASIPTLLVPR